MALNYPFPLLVRREFAFLRDEYGYQLVREADHLVEFRSPEVSVVVTFDPRGEVEAVVHRLDAESRFAEVSFGGQVGRAPRVSCR